MESAPYVRILRAKFRGGRFMGSPQTNVLNRPLNLPPRNLAWSHFIVDTKIFYVRTLQTKFVHTFQTLQLK